MASTIRLIEEKLNEFRGTQAHFGPRQSTVETVIKAHNGFYNGSLVNPNGTGEFYNGVRCLLPSFVLFFYSAEGTMYYREGIVHVHIELFPARINAPNYVSPEDLQATVDDLLSQLPSEESGISYQKHTPSMDITYDQWQRIKNKEVSDMTGGWATMEGIEDLLKAALENDFEVNVLDENGYKIGNLNYDSGSDDFVFKSYTFNP
ncbi:hypothetical protein [Spirosoma oryzicola]|uniref:hypothetical protein n=1 Tax=Spirosoma oryzicola TaxID=2898794 RepID=UPI001E2CA170|nr:hypothetical protein [Spirosoma oryzicola]UHG93384.1 hypothetical protein LQ777_10875 [Spirosoma oryzicola]